MTILDERKESSGPPAWVIEARKLMMEKCREYAGLTGHAPEKELLEEYQRAGRAAIERHLDDPRRTDYRPMTILEFERRGRVWWA